MSYGRPDLRLDAPTLEPSDDLVHRLAAAARTSGVTVAASRRRHRIVVAVAAFVGISAVSVGGAWAVGAIDVPGIPSSPLREAVVEPDPPAPQEEQGSAPGGDADTGSGALPGEAVPARGGAPAGRENDAPARSAEPGSDVDGPAAEAPANGKVKDKEKAPVDRGQGQGETRSEDKGENGRHEGQEKAKEKKDRGDEASSGRQDPERGQGGEGSAKKSGEPEDEDQAAADG